MPVFELVGVRRRDFFIRCIRTKIQNLPVDYLETTDSRLKFGRAGADICTAILHSRGPRGTGHERHVYGNRAGWRRRGIQAGGSTSRRQFRATRINVYLAGTTGIVRETGVLPDFSHFDEPGVAWAECFAAATEF
jgi:hypothetical protein